MSHAMQERLARLARAMEDQVVAASAVERETMGVAMEDGWHDDAWGAGFLTQLRALTARSWSLQVRHPLLIATNAASTVLVGTICMWVFWHVDPGDRIELSSGVLQRMGLLFFLGAHFLLTGLAPLGVWRQEKLLYFHERGVGCYGAWPFVLSKTLLAEALPMRILPALLISAMVYPSAGLAGIGDQDASYPVRGPLKAAMFLASMCLTNLVSAAMFACIGIVCDSTAVAVFNGVFFALFTLLFSGFLANANLLPGALKFLPYLSCLRYNFELVLSNELLGHLIAVNRLYPGDPHAGENDPVPGYMIITEYLAFNTGWQEHCYRTIPIDSQDPDDQISACWLDLYVPAAWFIAALPLSVLLLKYCAKDPH